MHGKERLGAWVGWEKGWKGRKDLMFLTLVALRSSLEG
jgi:hypothetical protein